jgi:hypothetical protein
LKLGEEEKEREGRALTRGAEEAERERRESGRAGGEAGADRRVLTRGAEEAVEEREGAARGSWGCWAEPAHAGRREEEEGSGLGPTGLAAFFSSSFLFLFPHLNYSNNSI